MLKTRYDGRPKSSHYIGYRKNEIFRRMRYLNDSEDSLNERRGDLGIQALEEAQNSATGGKSTAALLPVRVALAMVFMYLVMFSYTMMGPT